jgi:hypothetical protein
MMQLYLEGNFIREKILMTQMTFILIIYNIKVIQLKIEKVQLQKKKKKKKSQQFPSNSDSRIICNITALSVTCSIIEMSQYFLHIFLSRMTTFHTLDTHACSE